MPITQDEYEKYEKRGKVFERQHNIQTEVTTIAKEATSNAWRYLSSELRCFFLHQLPSAVYKTADFYIPDGLESVCNSLHLSV